MVRKLLILLFSCFLVGAHAGNLSHLFYTDDSVSNPALNDAEILKEINRNHTKISILAPQAYQIDQNGIIWGSIDKNVLELCQQYQIKVMPLIINQDFDQTQLHQLFNNPVAMDRAIQTMIAICKKNHYYGFQFDFENININDKDGYTAFFHKVAQAMHQQGFILSAAIVPRISDELKNDYDRWYYINWTGAYDYQALAKDSDFITLMAYDCHSTLTTPGPIAPYFWTQQLLLTLLKTVPANKISLGIPAYSGYWNTGELAPDSGSFPEKYQFRSREHQISYATAQSLLKKNNAKLIWDDEKKVLWSVFVNQHMNEYLFIENAQTFKPKYDLAKQYHLQGISVWKLGVEDPNIWTVFN